MQHDSASEEVPTTNSAESAADQSVTEDDGVFNLAPAEEPPLPAAFISAKRNLPRKPGSLTPHELERRQISISGLLVVVTAISLVLTPAGFLSLPVYAAVLGTLLFLLFVISSFLGARELIVRVTLWSLVAVYLITLLVASSDQLEL
ncbi:MAG: hypothetical protein MPJ50_12640 [Pirellulales bacterium]|nr:hypothetical protein [Pirellulales bacterium]